MADCRELEPLFAAYVDGEAADCDCVALDAHFRNCPPCRSRIEAERIVKEARERQTRLVSEQEITKQAERAAEDIIEDARAREREIRLGAEDYADEILNTLEVNLQKFLAAVQRGRDRLAGRDEEPVAELDEQQAE